MASDLIVSASRAPALSRNWSLLVDVRDMEHFRQARLVPDSDVRAVQADLDRAIQPCSETDAAKIAGLLVGSYPKHLIAEPEIYTRAMVSLLAEYPASVGARAVDIVTRKCKFMPTRAEVCEELDALMRKLQWAKFVADRTSAERDRRKQEIREGVEREAARRMFREKHGGKSPLDVLIEKGLYSKGNDDGKETDGGSHSAQGGDADRPNKNGKPKRGR